MRTIIKRIRQLEEALRTPLMTAEFRVLAHLYEAGGTSSSQLMGVSRMSPSGFHILRKRLLGRGVLVTRRDDDDSRSVIYELAPSVLKAFNAIDSSMAIAALVDPNAARKHSKVPSPARALQDGLAEKLQRI